MKYMQSDFPDSGRLQINLYRRGTTLPVTDATVTISSTGNPDQVLESLTTDSSGQTQTIELPAPPVEYSLEKNNLIQPYSEYNLIISAYGYDPVSISGTEILSGVTAIQNTELTPSTTSSDTEDIFVIGGHTLYEQYPAKIPEAEVKPVDESGEIVLSRVVVPEYIVVHDGSPTDSTATNYYERYRDYIKNVASSEIYATWPTNTIYANILAIMSFTLNRVYTEWYRNQGYDFTITSSTAYDHKWTPNRNSFDTISQAVDEIFADYLSRPNVRQPILTQYCDGRNVTCPNWLSQWGSKSLGDQGYSIINILRYYYGEDLYINTAEEISGVPSSWPGYTLEIGSSGQKVRMLQEELNVIAGAYPALPKVAEDSIYGANTAESVREFQKIFGLPQTGTVDYSTWYKISQIYVGVSRIAELS